MKPIDVKWSACIDFGIQNNKKDPKYKVDDHVRISNIKIFVLKVTLQIGLKKFLWLKKLIILCCGYM